MSRNFELMTMLELEARARDNRTSAGADRAAATVVAPIPSGRAENSGGEEILRLVQRIFLSANGSAPRQVVFCGVSDKSGSSSLCTQVGRTLAANGSLPVCLVDANVRSPRLASVLGVEGTNPFSGSSARLREQCVRVGGNLWFAGPSIVADKSGALLPPTQLKDRLAELRYEFEYMLIDAPGTSVCGDAQLLGLFADAAILVVEANSTRRLTARKAKETLDGAGVRLLGTVLHNRSFPIPESLYRRL
jgi:Mrp family chromosome partitioning ATPase